MKQQSNKPSNTKIPEHIKSYRYESWQIEMLIAGGILFGLFQSSDVLKTYFYQLYPVLEITSNKIILLFGSYVIIKILLIGFSANLFLRAVWLGYLGISFWFPNDINYNRIYGSQNYKNQLKSEPSVQRRLLTLEKWCNLSFSFAVLLGFLAISLLVSLSLIIWLLDSNSLTADLANNAIMTYGILIFIVISQIGLMDRLLATKEHQKSIRNSIRTGVVTVLKIITLSFLYKREYLVLRSNTNSVAFYAFILLYLGIAVITSVNQIGKFYEGGTFTITFMDDRTMYKDNAALKMGAVNYETNINKGGLIFRGAIQSEVIEGDYVKLFLVSWKDFDNFLEERYTKYGHNKDLSTHRKQKELDSLVAIESSKWQKSVNDLFSIQIDSTKIQNLKWFQYTHPNSNEDGYVTYIPILDLPFGQHDLQVDTKIKFNNGVISTRRWLEIPFWTH